MNHMGASTLAAWRLAHAAPRTQVTPNRSLNTRSGKMIRYVFWLATVALAMIFCVNTHAASQVFKCVANGSVTFQSSPCPTASPSRQPTVDELNALRKKRLAEAASQAASAPKPVQSPVTAASKPPDAPEDRAAPRDQGFRCDSRRYCSQMRSCSEAKFFLANCPGVQMDGNRDGTPCEKQWCTHPLAK